MTTKLTLFDPLEQTKQAEMLAKHMPTGKIWEACFDDSTHMGKLIVGLADEIYRVQLLIKEAIDEININKTDKLLPDYEESVGIPDLCFSNTVTKAERRNQVLQKFTNFQGVQKASDFVRVAASFGISVTVQPSVQLSEKTTFPLPFPFGFSEGPHTITVIVLGISEGIKFPLPFPMKFHKGVFDFLRCIFNILAPANVKVIIRAE